MSTQILITAHRLHDAATQKLAALKERLERTKQHHAKLHLQDMEEFVKASWWRRTFVLEKPGGESEFGVLNRTEDLMRRWVEKGIEERIARAEQLLALASPNACSACTTRTVLLDADDARFLQVTAQ